VVIWVALSLGVSVLAAIFSQLLIRIFPPSNLIRSRLGILVAELGEMSSTFRRRLDILTACVGISVATQGLNVLAFYLVGRTLFPSLATTLEQHFLIVPLTLFSTALPLPFGALGISEEVGDQLFKLVGHPSGALATIGYRVLLYCCTLILLCFYFARLEEVRGLMATASDLADDAPEGQPLEEGESIPSGSA
jgi:hypothetical protein